MLNNEVELVDMICKDNNPTQALEIAAKIIADYLTHRESCQEQAAADLPVSA